METDATLIQGAEDPRADKFVAEMEELGGKLREARAVVGSVIFGQYDVVDQSLVTLLAGGHALLVGVPGLAKTRLVETLGQVLGLSERRVQFTPDLMMQEAGSTRPKLELNIPVFTRSAEVTKQCSQL